MNLITAQLIRIFNIPNLILQNDKEREYVIKEFTNTEIIQSAINSVKFLQKEHVVRLMVAYLTLSLESSSVIAHQIHPYLESVTTIPSQVLPPWRTEPHPTLQIPRS